MFGPWRASRRETPSRSPIQARSIPSERCTRQPAQRLFRTAAPARTFNRESVPGFSRNVSRLAPIFLAHAACNGGKTRSPRLLASGKPPAPSRCRPIAGQPQWLIAGGATDYSGATASELHGLPFDERIIWRTMSTLRTLRAGERTSQKCRGFCPVQQKST